MDPAPMERALVRSPLLWVTVGLSIAMLAFFVWLFSIAFAA
jgi:hypothetical protein